MIDEKTGELISENGVVIGPNLKRDSFLASEIGESSKIFVRNEPWCSYRIEGLKISGLVFVVVLYFYGLDLNEIEICNSDVRFGETWSDWSLENELKRKQSHDKWLDPPTAMDLSAVAPGLSGLKWRRTKARPAP